MMRGLTGYLCYCAHTLDERDSVAMRNASMRNASMRNSMRNSCMRDASVRCPPLPFPAPHYPFLPPRDAVMRCPHAAPCVPPNTRARYHFKLKVSLLCFPIFGAIPCGAAARAMRGMPPSDLASVQGVVVS
jgi:hypothetical protein